MQQDAAITQLLHAAADGDRAALEEVSSLLYRELEQLAAAKLRRRYGRGLAGATLESGALVNETLLKVLRSQTEFVNRRHFYSFANRVMSRALVDYERRKHASKRGAGLVRMTLSGLAAERPATFSGVVAALERLAELDQRKADVVQLRCFWGMEHREIAEALEVSLTTVERDWRFARAWLQTELEERC